MFFDSLTGSWMSELRAEPLLPAPRRCCRHQAPPPRPGERLVRVAANAAAAARSAAPAAPSHAALTQFYRVQSGFECSKLQREYQTPFQKALMT